MGQVGIVCRKESVCAETSAQCVATGWDTRLASCQGVSVISAAIQRNSEERSHFFNSNSQDSLLKLFSESLKNA